MKMMVKFFPTIFCISTGKNEPRILHTIQFFNTNLCNNFGKLRHVVKGLWGVL